MFHLPKPSTFSLDSKSPSVTHRTGQLKMDSFLKGTGAGAGAGGAGPSSKPPTTSIEGDANGIEVDDDFCFFMEEEGCVSTDVSLPTSPLAPRQAATESLPLLPPSKRSKRTEEEEEEVVVVGDGEGNLTNSARILANSLKPSPSIAPPPAAASSSQWTCAHCTFINQEQIAKHFCAVRKERTSLFASLCG